MADVSGLAGNVTLGITGRADPVEGFVGNIRLGRGQKIMEVASQMRPTGRFAQTLHTIGIKLLEPGITPVTVRLQNAASTCQMAENMLLLPVRCGPIDSTGRY